MRPITNIIHETENAFRNPAIAGVIFDDYGLTRDANGFLEQRHRIVGMVENVHKYDAIHAVVVVRKVQSVIFGHWNCTSRTFHYVDAPDPKLGTGVADQAGNDAIAATNIEYVSVRRQQAQRMTGENPEPPAEYQACVNACGE